MEFYELAKNRYSCRKMSDKKVEKELLDKIIDTAIAAPTAVNTQSFKIFLMDSQEAKQNIHKVCNYTFGADTFLVLGCEEKGSWVRSFDEQRFSQVDGSIVATHMMMEIEDLGLATTWVGCFDAPQLKKMYPCMEGYDLIALFPVGYAAEDAAPSPRHSQRKSREQLVEVL